MIAVTLLALVLVAAVPMALLAAVIMMLLGHVVLGLAVFGGSVLAAGLAVAIAGMSGTRQLRKLISEGPSRIVRLNGSQFMDVTEPAEQQDSAYDNLVQLDRSEYTEVR